MGLGVKCLAAVSWVVLWVVLDQATSSLLSQFRRGQAQTSAATSSAQRQCTQKPSPVWYTYRAKSLDSPDHDGVAAGENRAAGPSQEDLERKNEEERERVSATAEADTARRTNTERQATIVGAFRHAWNGYREHAWGRDTLRPISHGHEEWFDLGVTLVDSLDTMHLMGLDAEFAEAREWVSTSLDVGKDRDVNVFETTIRVMGGLLSAFHLSNDTLFKDKAVELADNLLPAFATSTGIPLSDVNLFQGNASSPKWTAESSIAEVTTIQMEFREISRLTGDSKYQELVDKAMTHVQSQPILDGLVDLFINPHSGVFTKGTLTLGARADSYYEYLLKQWLQCNRTEHRFADWYRTSLAGIEKHLVRHSVPSHLLFVGEQLSNGEFNPKMDHLVCFLPGLLALGSAHGVDAERSGDHLELAQQLMYTCLQMYFAMPTGLSAELVYFGQHGGESDIMVRENDRHNLLRPEAVESLFVLYRVTGNDMYREWGWNLFSAFEKHCKVAGGGYTSIGDVSSVDNTQPRDKMESFFLAETLKYLYLLFGDDKDVLPLSKYVFNTEAHPLPVWESVT